MRTTGYTKPNRPINFLPNSSVRDIKKPIWGLFTPWDQNIWAPPLFRNQLYGTHTSSNLSSAETRNRGSNVAISTRHTIPCPSLPTRVGSHEYGNNGESFYQRRPLQLLVVFTQIPTTIRFNLDGFNNDEMIFFSHTHKNSSPTLLVCEGDLYGASCPPLLGSEQQKRGDNLFPLPIRGAPQQGPLGPLAQQGGSWLFEQQHILWPSF